MCAHRGGLRGMSCRGRRMSPDARDGEQAMCPHGRRSAELAAREIAHVFRCVGVAGSPALTTVSWSLGRIYKDVRVNAGAAAFALRGYGAQGRPGLVS